MKSEITREFVADTLAQSILDPRTRALYELCFLHRHHFQDDIVADKLRMIVRLCAEQGLAVSGFSPELSAHRLGHSGVDRWFAGLATAEQLDPALVFEIHNRVMAVFTDLPVEQARSLAAKYLHFHFQELFYLYDSRVEAAAFDLGEGDCGYLSRVEHDPTYGRFFACCRKLSDQLVDLAGRRLNPRELDRVLRAWADYKDLVAMPASPRQAPRFAAHA